jgi:UDP-N-acetylmuramyl-tripeptide synthetase/UDP-N-acetylmuramoyl-tripeptide--D-alanyl-D-alanine ligase
MTTDRILQVLKEHDLLLEYQETGNIDINGKICVDNRLLERGDIFICVKGQKADGHSFITEARSKGASLVICEEHPGDEYPAVRVSSSRKALALLAGIYYKNPSSQFRMVGVTGTNGKTTTTRILFEAIRTLGFKAGWIGTHGYSINDESFTTKLTTPDTLELNEILARMAEKKVLYVFMEVSSHALAQDRVYGIEFDYCLFTNLSREHLDYHKNMEEYGAVKTQLFKPAVSQQAVALINIDDGFGHSLFGKLKSEGAYVFSIGSSEADYLIRTDHLPNPVSWDMSRFTLQAYDVEMNIRSPLLGKFNITNLAMAAATMNLMGFEKRQVEQGINSVQPVRGRFERIPNEKNIGVFIDYAHTPDALENVLKASREIEHRRVLCLFGAGGDRDQGKRPLMLRSALQNADAVVITDDNPRSEDPDQIIRDIVGGCDPWLPWWVIRDRKEAIHAILRLAQPGDIVLICGKGHETYQEIEGVRYPFDDAEIAREYLRNQEHDQNVEAGLALPVDKLLLDIIAEKPAGDHLCYNPSACYKYISTDSRTIKAGSVFFALEGSNFDGNEFLDAVLQQTENVGIGTKRFNEPAPQNYIFVQNSLGVMADLCRKYLTMFGVYKIAITGSTGKSSIKELLWQVFSTQGATLKTFENQNNMIGLCKTVFTIKPEHKYAILELGTNAVGEIAALSELCDPDAAIIANIGPSHLEFLVDEEGVFKEKSTLFDRPLDIRIYDADDPRFSAYQSIAKGVGYAQNSNYRITELVIGQKQSTFVLNGERFSIPYISPHMVKNAAFAIAMGTQKSVSVQSIQLALDSPIDLKMRLSNEMNGDMRLIVDCYNANPMSMQVAIEYWDKLDPAHLHIAILGDMLELGQNTALYHEMIGAMLSERGIGKLITIGKESVHYHGSLDSKAVSHFENVEELINSGILKTLVKDSVVLIKGSHGMHLEKLLPYLREQKP